MDTRPPRVGITSGVAQRDRARGAGRGAPGARQLQRPAQPQPGVPRLPHRRDAVAGGAAVPRRPLAQRCLGRHRPRRRPAPDGSYSFYVQVRDLAGNLDARARAGSADRGRRALRAPASRCAGSRCRARSEPVSAGALATLRVGPAPRRFEFALSRLGSRRNIRRDRRRGGRLRVRIPRDAHTGVYLVRVRAGGRRAVWPVAVAGRAATARAARRPRPIVVLPAVTWQGLEPLGLRPGRLRRHSRRRAGGPRRAPVREAAPAAAVRLRGLAAAAVPRPRAAGLRPHHRPGARPPPRARRSATRRGWRSPAAPSGSRAGCATGCARRSRRAACGWSRSAATRSSARWRWWGRCCATPARARPDDLFGERTERSSAPTRRRRCARSRTTWACSAAWTRCSASSRVFERSVELPAGARLLTAGGTRGGAGGLRRLHASARAPWSARAPRGGRASWRRGA